MNRRFVITALVTRSLLVVRLASALEEQQPKAGETAPAAAAPTAAAPAAAEAPAEPPAAKFKPDQLDQLVGPIALYADPLLIQVLIAAT